MSDRRSVYTLGVLMWTLGSIALGLTVGHFGATVACFFLGSGASFLAESYRL